MTEKKHRAAAQREFAEICDAIEADHVRLENEFLLQQSYPKGLARLERAILLLRDELLNNPDRRA